MSRKTSSPPTKNSVHGTTSCDQTSELDGSSIIKIITACRANGVRQFEFQSLKFQFDEPAQVHTVHIAPENAERVACDTEYEELRLRQETLETLRLSDPLQYEEMMRHNELELEINDA